MRKMKMVLAITLCFTFIGIGSAFAQNEAQAPTKVPDQSVAAPVVVEPRHQDGSNLYLTKSAKRK